MPENKTKVTETSVESYLSAIEDGARRKDCEALVELMSQVTNEQPRMWGTSIVGFGTYHYKYESGREGESSLAGFSSRKGDIALYLAANYPGHAELLARLGKHKMGKACLYIRRLSDVDLPTLEKLVARSVEEIKRQHSQ